MNEKEFKAKSWAHAWGEPVLLGTVLAGRRNDKEIKQQFDAIHNGWAWWPGWYE